MDVEWDSDEGRLTIDGAEYFTRGDGPVEVRTHVLRQLRPRDLPVGVEVQAVRRVAGGHDLYGDPEDVVFFRSDAGDFLRIETALVVDEDEEPSAAQRVVALERQAHQVEALLRAAREAERVVSFKVSEVTDNEIVYVDYTVSVVHDERSVYDLLQAAPSLDHGDLLPSASPAALLAVLWSIPGVDYPSEVDFLIEVVRPFIRALGHRPAALSLVAPTSTHTADALLRPYALAAPLMALELRLWPGSVSNEKGAALARKALESAGASSGVLLSPGLVAAVSGDREISFRPNEADMATASRLLDLLAVELVATPSAKRVRPSGGLAALAEAIRAAKLAQTADEKGRRYEELACAALALIPGLRVKHRRLLTDTSEIDIVVEYLGEPRIALFEEAGRYALGECKNWSASTGAREIRDFLGKLRACKARIGLMFSRFGVTGIQDKNAIGVVKHAFQQDGTIVAVLTLDDLEAVLLGEDLLSLIDKQCDAVRFQTA